MQRRDFGRQNRNGTGILIPFQVKKLKIKTELK
jgi:hypothetical protein